MGNMLKRRGTKRAKNSMEFVSLCEEIAGTMAYLSITVVELWRNVLSVMEIMK